MNFKPPVRIGNSPEALQTPPPPSALSLINGWLFDMPTMTSAPVRASVSRTPRRRRKFKFDLKNYPHIIVVEDGKLSCTLCNNKTIREILFHYHKYCADIKAGRPTKFACHFCNQSFKCGSHLQYHILTHSSERAYVCLECGSDFLTQPKLKRHIDMCHKNFKAFVCHCSRKFSSKQALTKHEKLHSGPSKPFQCPDCGKTFAAKSSMMQHKAYAHDGSMKFICDICHKCLGSRSGLVAHAKIHKKEMQFVCVVCGRPSWNYRDSTRHQATHERIKRFICAECQSEYSRKDNLIRHLKTVHKVKDGEMLKASIVYRTDNENETITAHDGNGTISKLDPVDSVPAPDSPPMTTVQSIVLALPVEEIAVGRKDGANQEENATTENPEKELASSHRSLAPFSIPLHDTVVFDKGLKWHMIRIGHGLAWLVFRVKKRRLRIEAQIIGFDEYMNLVMDNAEEVDIKKSTRKPVGRILLKGGNITLIQDSNPKPYRDD